MKKLFTVIFLLFCLTSCTISACYRDDIPEAPFEAEKKAQEFIYKENLGIIVSEEEGQLIFCSCIQLTNELIVTAAHSNVGKKDTQKFYIPGTAFDIPLIQNRNKKWVYDTKFLKEDLKNYITCHYIYLPIEKKNVKKECNIPIDLNKNLETVFNQIVKIIEKDKFENFNDWNGFTEEGGDWAILRLDTPRILKHLLPIFPFNDIKTNTVEACILGISDQYRWSSGKYQPRIQILSKDSILSTQRYTMICQKITRHSRLKLYYHMFQSPGGQEHFFETQNLPKEDRLTGMTIGGMSGGGVFFKTKEGNLALGAIIQGRKIVNIIQELKNVPNINPLLIDKLMKKSFPVHNIFQSLEDLPKVLNWINILEKNGKIEEVALQEILTTLMIINNLTKERRLNLIEAVKNPLTEGIKLINSLTTEQIKSLLKNFKNCI